MRMDKLKNWTDFRNEVVAISRAIAVAQTQPTPMDIGAVGKEKPGKGGKGAKGAGKRNNQTQQAFSSCGNMDHTSAHCPHSDKTFRRPTAVRRAREVAKVRMLSKHFGLVVRADTCRRNAPRRRSLRVRSQDTNMVGSVESYFDVGSVSEVTIEPRGAGENICSMYAPNAREGESVDIDIDSGVEVSCFLLNIGADTYPLHETRLSMCGGHRVAAGGGKLYELGASILGLEAANVQSDVVNLLVRLRVMNIGKALVSTQDLSRCGWEDGLPCRLWKMHTSSGNLRTLASRS